MAEIAPLRGAEDYAQAEALLREYAQTPGVVSCFDRFDEDLRDLDAVYGPPGGRFLIARLGGEAAGCVALRRLGEGVCEMKRLYVRPAHRGRQIGRALAEAIAAAAREMGYAIMRLETLSTMAEAQALYRSMGFAAIPPYHGHPVEGSVFMELDLRRTGEPPA